MFDIFSARYQFPCATTGAEVSVALSQFRSLEQLPGAASPTVYKVTFDCACGVQHDGLLSHDELDWEPLSNETTETFFNFQTGSRDLVAAELSQLTSEFIRKGAWPWTFYCYPESAVRPGFPSSLLCVAPTTGQRRARQGVVVHCASCSRMSINFVTSQHLDVPFYNDQVVHYVDKMLPGERLSVEEAFRQQLNYRDFPTDWAEVG